MRTALSRRRTAGRITAQRQRSHPTSIGSDQVWPNDAAPVGELTESLNGTTVRAYGRVSCRTHRGLSVRRRVTTTSDPTTGQLRIERTGNGAHLPRRAIGFATDIVPSFGASHVPAVPALAGISYPWVNDGSTIQIHGDSNLGDSAAINQPGRRVKSSDVMTWPCFAQVLSPTITLIPHGYRRNRSMTSRPAVSTPDEAAPATAAGTPRNAGRAVGGNRTDRSPCEGLVRHRRPGPVDVARPPSRWRHQRPAPSRVS
jgi:hypothetical protein